MTVIKRNGSEVTFDITKIIAAITKANESVYQAQYILFPRHYAATI